MSKKNEKNDNHFTLNTITYCATGEANIWGRILPGQSEYTIGTRRLKGDSVGKKKKCKF